MMDVGFQWFFKELLVILFVIPCDVVSLYKGAISIWINHYRSMNITVKLTVDPLES